jgi:hypothetical protein
LLEPYQEGSYMLVVKDSYRNGGYPDKVLLLVTTPEAILIRHDLAASAFSGDIEVSLGHYVPGERKSVRIDLLAVRPEPGTMWGATTPVEIRVQLNPGGG